MTNIMLLTIDALRADHVSWHGYQRDTTPFLNAFSQRCKVFKSAYSTSSHTRESVPSILAGCHPTEAITDEFTRGTDTLPMLLPDEYSTAAFHSNPYLSRAYGYDSGFDTFYDDLNFGQNKLLALVQRALDKLLLSRGEYHARAAEINERALSWIPSVSDLQPFFLWNHYMDVHGPYNPPSKFSDWSEVISNTKAQRLYDRLSGDEPPSKEDVELARDLYDGEIRYIDAQIRTFIQSLEERGLLDESLVLITSDHGDLFGENGQYAHPRYVCPELTRVPLMVYGPNVTPETISEPVSTIDIVPTALQRTRSQGDLLPGNALIDREQFDQNRFVFSSAAGEGADEDVRRFAVNSLERGLRFTRDQTTGEITNETWYKLPSGKEVDSNNSAEFKSLRAALIEHSDVHLNRDTSVKDEETPSSNTDIEKRLEALGYK